MLGCKLGLGPLCEKVSFYGTFQPVTIQHNTREDNLVKFRTKDVYETKHSSTLFTGDAVMSPPLVILSSTLKGE
jgi:hypothetical protein